MNHLRVEHVAGRYYLHPSIDVTQEPAYPGDVAELDIVHWEVWADAKQDAQGNWTFEWIENYHTEEAGRVSAHRLAETDAA